MFAGKKKKELASLNYLELTPNRVYGDEQEETGLISVMIPRFTNKLLVRFLSPRLKSPYVKARLDEFGSEVWKLMDGSRTVEQVANKLKEKFGEKVEPVNERLTKFLTQIHMYKFISFNELKK